jgi:hypothetical protein
MTPTTDEIKEALKEIELWNSEGREREHRRANNMKHPPLWNSVVYFVAACVVGILLIVSIIILLRG